MSTDPRARFFADESDEDLLAARRHPNMGDVGRARIDAELERRKKEAPTPTMGEDHGRNDQ